MYIKKSKQVLKLCLLGILVVSVLLYKQRPLETISDEQIQTLLDEKYPVFDIGKVLLSSIYSKLDVLHMLNLSLDKRCELYFNNFDKVDPNHEFEYDRFDYLYWNQYESDSIKKLDQEVTEDLKSSIKESFESSRKKIAHDEQVIYDYLHNVKVFNKCFIERNDTTIKHQQSLLSGFAFPKLKQKAKYSIKELETRVFPWLTQKSPEFETLNKKYHLFDSFKSSFFKKWSESLSGKGIVMTIGDEHVDDCVRLLRLLSYLDNKLPIQVIYATGTLSVETKDKLKATDQNITLVNVATAVKKEYASKFEKFGFKILAILFNSFEEIIFLDADTIVTLNPENFFNLSKYKSSGTLFFRDRNTPEYRPTDDFVLFYKLMNNQLDHALFDLKQITEHTKSSPMFGHKINHIMESGLVVINRKQHFYQPIMMANMNFYLPVQKRVYGDKELFWLSLSMMGDENWQFNKNPAASIGELTPLQDRILEVGKAYTFQSNEICSNHPAHINDEDDHTLLWFNSGFKFCNQIENVKFEDEFQSKKRYNNLNFEQFKTFMSGELIMTHAIIPPENTATEPFENEPKESWRHLDYCAGYTWCAYDRIGKGEKENDNGKLVQFTSEEIEHFKKLADIWSNV